MLKSLGPKHTQLNPGFGAKAHIRLAIKSESQSFALHPTEIGTVKAQPVADNALRQRTRDNLFGLELLFRPEGHDVPEFKRFDLVSRVHFKCRLTFQMRGASQQAKRRWRSVPLDLGVRPQSITRARHTNPREERSSRRAYPRRQRSYRNRGHGSSAGASNSVRGGRSMPPRGARPQTR